MTKERPPGVKTIKRSYVNAREVYSEVNSLLSDLQRAAARLPDGILAPAIDLMFDKRDAAAEEYRKWHQHCMDRKIRTAYGFRINPQLCLSMKTNRDRATGRYVDTRLDQPCATCGHTLGQHSAVRAAGQQPCFADAFGCACLAFKRAKR